MNELLIELFSEEIPALMQLEAEKAYLNIFMKYFKDRKISYNSIKTFSGPRRITIFANGITKEVEGKVTYVQGPRVSSSIAAINGFCQFNSINQDDLIIRKVGEIEYYFGNKKTSIQKTSTVFLNTLPSAVLEYAWPKSMYWSTHKIKWVRPLRNILCIFDGKTVPFKLGHLTANNLTFGHKTMYPKKIVVKDFDSYQVALEKTCVILDRKNRKDKIEQGIKAKLLELSQEKDIFYSTEDNQSLLEEVAGLVEYPFVLRGKIDQKFLALPEEVLISSMRIHQKYFCLFRSGKVECDEKNIQVVTKKSSFTPFFLFVTNIKSLDYSAIIKGNEQVLSARLYDALYFYQEDLKKDLSDLLNELTKVIFHTKLGSLKEKTNRLIELTNYISPESEKEEAAEAALFSKVDLVSKMVTEYPDLQGIMGYYYTLSKGKKEKVALAIRDHYKARVPSRFLSDYYRNSNNISATLSLADKLDSLCGLMLAGERATASKDPYGLRRLAIGIIKIILDNKDNELRSKDNLQILISYSCNLYSKIIDYTSQDVNRIINFLEERIKNYFKDKFNYSIVKVVVDCQLEPSICRIAQKIEAFNDFFNTENGKHLLISYKRISNIISGSELNKEINTDFLYREEEKKLLQFLEVLSLKVNFLIEEGRFFECLEELAKMNSIIKSFFANVLVLDKNLEIRNNRFLLLARVKQVFSKLGNFDLL